MLLEKSQKPHKFSQLVATTVMWQCESPRKKLVSLFESDKELIIICHIR